MKPFFCLTHLEMEAMHKSGLPPSGVACFSFGHTDWVQTSMVKLSLGSCVGRKEAHREISRGAQARGSVQNRGNTIHDD